MAKLPTKPVEMIEAQVERVLYLWAEFTETPYNHSLVTGFIDWLESGRPTASQRKPNVSEKQ